MRNDYLDYISHTGVLGMRWGIRRYQPYLAHHGILGQKHGVRNGPPYPLSAGAHSRAERRYMGAPPGSKSEAERRQETNTNSKYAFAAKMVVDVLTLSPIGLVRDAKRLAELGKAQANIAMEKTRTEKLKVDDKTGLRLKDTKSTPEEDMKHINPGFKNFDTNTKNNCMLCTTAYELRRRGYDVQAGTATHGYMRSDVLEWFPDGKIETAYSILSDDKKERTKNIAKFTVGLGGTEKYNKLSDSLLKHGDGARGNLMVGWGQSGGHSMVWEVQNGQVVIRDCQSNKVYRGRMQIANILAKTVDAQYVRTDNIDFDLKKIKELIQ